MKHTYFEDRILIVFLYITTGAFALVCMAPLWLALVSSITNENELFREGYRFFTTKFDFTSYKLLFTSTATVYNAYGVTIFTTAAGVLLTLFLTSSIAYPLSVKALKYRNKISFYVYMTMLFNGGLVPTYILTSKYLHLGNNILVLIIPMALNAYNFFLMKNYFNSIPESISESAKIDGANDIYIFARIILPLSKPILATIALFAAMGYWNQWFPVLLYIDNEKLYTLQYLIMRLQRTADFMTSSFGAKVAGGVQIPTLGIRMATAMVSIGPIIILYPILQKYFIKGLVIGAVKG